MKPENVRELKASENDAIYWALNYTSQNPSAVGLDADEAKSARELFEMFKHGQFRISENMSVIE